MDKSVGRSQISKIRIISKNMQEGEAWCGFECSNEQALYIQYICLLLSLLLWGYLLWHIRTKMSNPDFSYWFRFYCAICLWLGCFTIKTSISIFAFVTYVNVEDEQSIIQEHLKIWSISFMIVNITTLFLLHTMMNELAMSSIDKFRIELSLCDRAWASPSQLKSNNPSEQYKISAKPAQNRYLWIVNFYSYYRWFRLAYLVYFLSFVINIFVDYMLLLRDIGVIILILDNIIIFTSFAFNFKLYYIYKKYKQIDNTKTFIRVYLWLFFIGLARMVILGEVFFTNNYQYIYSKTCKNIYQESYFVDNIILAIGNIITSLLCAAIVLWCNHPRNMKVRESMSTMLNSTENEGFQSEE